MGSSRYSLDEARKCEDSEAQALLGELLRLGEGDAEWRRRQAAAKFKHGDDGGTKAASGEDYGGTSAGAAMEV